VVHPLPRGVRETINRDNHLRMLPDPSRGAGGGGLGGALSTVRQPDPSAPHDRWKATVWGTVNRGEGSEVKQGVDLLGQQKHVHLEVRRRSQQGPGARRANGKKKKEGITREVETRTACRECGRADLCVVKNNR